MQLHRISLYILSAYHHVILVPQSLLQVCFSIYSTPAGRAFFFFFPFAIFNPDTLTCCSGVDPSATSLKFARRQSAFVITVMNSLSIEICNFFFS